MTLYQWRASDYDVQRLLLRGVVYHEHGRRTTPLRGGGASKGQLALVERYYFNLTGVVYTPLS